MTSSEKVMSEQEIQTAYNELMIADALAVVEFLQKNKDKYVTLSAMFNAKGERIEGTDKIVVVVSPVSEKDNQWFYSVQPIKDYVFIKIPVEPCHIDYGTLQGEKNPSSEYFRFTPSALTTFSSDSKNLSVSFSVVGYKPKQILDRLEAK